MFIDRKIITSKQLKTVRAKNSTVMKDFLAKGAGDVMKKKALQKEFWGDLRHESESHKFGERGYTKKGLTKFLGGLLENKKDHFTDRKVKKIANALGIRQGKLLDAAAEVRAEHHKANFQSEHQQREVEIHRHIDDIISRARDRSGVGSSGIQSILSGHENTSLNHPFKEHIEYSQEPIDTKFSINEIKAGKSEEEKEKEKKERDNYQKLRHELLISDRQQENANEKLLEMEDVKTRLARIQGKTNGEKTDKISEPIG